MMDSEPPKVAGRMDMDSSSDEPLTARGAGGERRESVPASTMGVTALSR